MSKEIVACRRIVSGRKVRSELARFCDRDAGPFGAVGVAGRDQDHAWDAMEATGVYWKPVWRVLCHDFSLVLANASPIRNAPGRKERRQRRGLNRRPSRPRPIRASFVAPQPIQDLRDLTRTRRGLTREIVRHTQRIQATLEEHQAGLGHFRHPGRDAAGAS